MMVVAACSLARARARVHVRHLVALISRPDGAGGRRASRGRAHSFVGTAVYMSPERLQGEPYGSSADVWSLGLTLLTLAIGKYPLEVHPTIFTFSD